MGLQFLSSLTMWFWDRARWCTYPCSLSANGRLVYFCWNILNRRLGRCGIGSEGRRRSCTAIFVSLLFHCCSVDAFCVAPNKILFHHPEVGCCSIWLKAILLQCVEVLWLVGLKFRNTYLFTDISANTIALVQTWSRHSYVTEITFPDILVYVFAQVKMSGE